MDSTLNLDQLIKYELEEWKKLGVPDPASVVNSNSFIDSVKIQSLINILIQKEIFNPSDFDTAYKTQMLNSLREARDGLNKARMDHITKGITH